MAGRNCPRPPPLAARGGGSTVGEAYAIPITIQDAEEGAGRGPAARGSPARRTVGRALGRSVHGRLLGERAGPCSETAPPHRNRRVPAVRNLHRDRRRGGRGADPARRLLHLRHPPGLDPDPSGAAEPSRPRLPRQGSPSRSLGDTHRPAGPAAIGKQAGQGGRHAPDDRPPQARRGSPRPRGPAERGAAQPAQRRPAGLDGTASAGCPAPNTTALSLNCCGRPTERSSGWSPAYAGTRNDLIRSFAQRAVNVVMKHMALLESTGLVDYSILPEPPAPSPPPATAALDTPVRREIS